MFQDLLDASENLSLSVKFPVEAGYGDHAYRILVDIKHKIHGLNRIRMDLNFNYYWKDAYPRLIPLHKHVSPDHTARHRISDSFSRAYELRFLKEHQANCLYCTER